MARVGAISFNTAMISILFTACVMSLFKGNKKNGLKKSLFPIKTLAFPILVVGILAPLSFTIQAKSMLQFVITDLLPFSLIFYCIQSEKDMKTVLYGFFASYIIIGTYGIFTFFMKGNPYVLLVALQSGYEGELYLGDYGAGRGALEGVATGSMTGALTWGQLSLITLLFSIIFFNKVTINKRLILIVIFLSLLNCFLSTKRSIMLPALLATSYFVIIKGKHLVSALIKVSFAIFILTIIAMQNKTVREVYESNIKTTILFWDDNLANEKGVTGSSLGMRIEQTEALFGIVGSYIIQGRGYGYMKEYAKKYEGKTDIRSFESIIFQVIVESGVLGLIIWFLFFLKLYQRTSIRGNRDVLVFHIMYLSSLLLTGIQAPLWAYMTFNAILIRRKEFCCMFRNRIKK